MRELRTGNGPPVMGPGEVLVALATSAAVVWLHHQQATLVIELARLGCETLRAIIGA
jgi:hypothetical protein